MTDKRKPDRIEITPALIEQYLQGRLDGKTMHAIERQALDDPFLAEALEGFEKRDPGQSRHIKELKERLHAKLKNEKSNPEKGWIVRYRNLQMAAAAILLILIGISIFFWTPQTTRINQMAYREDHSAAIPDTLPADTSSGASLAVEKGEKTPDTMNVLAHKTHQKQSLTGSVTVMPASPALMAARTSGNRLEISISRKPDEDTLLVTGKVKDSASGKPLQGVTVRVGGTEKGTISDASGHFKLTLPEKSDTLSFAYIGYETKHIVPCEAGQHLSVSLQSIHAGLNKLTVVGYGKKARKAFPKNEATPSGGFAAFRQYVKDSLRYPADAATHQIEGTVRLSFLVMPDSTIQDIQVTRSLGYGCDQEAIRLLREGPAWYPVDHKDTTLQNVEIHFKMKEE